MLAPLLSLALVLLLDPATCGPGRSWALSGLPAFRARPATPRCSRLGFSGLVVALPLSTRSGRWYAGPLAALNFALVVLSVTRMAVLASLVFALAYAVLSQELRAEWRSHRTKVLLILSTAAGVLILTWPTLEARMFDGPGEVNLSAPGRGPHPPGVGAHARQGRRGRAGHQPA